MLEYEAFTNYRSTDFEFSALAADIRPDVIVIEYLLSALFIRSALSLPTPIVTISLNDETRFHADMRAAQRLPPRVSRSILAQLRLARFERMVALRSNALVILSQGDLPSDRKMRERTVIISPVFDPVQDGWNYSASNELFFVGNISHYPNYLAVQWLAERMAPALERLRPQARIKVIGSSSDQVPPEWRRNNIEFMGFCDQAAVDDLFRKSDLFVGPIENAFGAKMKVMQCIARGTPILATAGALSGVNFKSSIPQFSLDDPEGAAALAADLLSSETRLRQLSRTMLEHRVQELKSRDDIWRSLIVDVAGHPRRTKARGALSWLWEKIYPSP